MSDNPFLDTLQNRLDLAPSQNYENKNILNEDNPEMINKILNLIKNESRKDLGKD